MSLATRALAIDGHQNVFLLFCCLILMRARLTITFWSRAWSVIMSTVSTRLCAGLHLCKSWRSKLWPPSFWCLAWAQFSTLKSTRFTPYAQCSYCSPFASAAVWPVPTSTHQSHFPTICGRKTGTLSKWFQYTLQASSSEWYSRY